MKRKFLVTTIAASTLALGSTAAYAGTVTHETKPRPAAGVHIRTASQKTTAHSARLPARGTSGKGVRITGTQSDPVGVSQGSGTRIGGGGSSSEPGSGKLIKGTQSDPGGACATWSTPTGGGGSFNCDGKSVDGKMVPRLTPVPTRPDAG